MNTATTATTALSELLGLLQDIDRDREGADRIMADWLEDHGVADLAERMRCFPFRRTHLHGWHGEVVSRCVAAGLMAWGDDPHHRRALAAHEALARVDLAGVPVMSADRRECSQKQQAKLTRELFKWLGVPGVRATCARGAFCDWVHVLVPARRDPDQVAASKAACDRVRQVLALGFPTHGDRTDPMSDHLDTDWRIELDY
jgi:hypothetical protein